MTHKFFLINLFFHLFQGFEYGRSGNPTRNVLETCLASLDNGKHGLCFSSGLGATTAVVSLLKSGDHLICGDDVYGGTNRYMRQVASKMGVEVEFVDATDSINIKNAIKANTRMLWIETPTNPLLKVVDIQHVSDVAHAFPDVSFRFFFCFFLLVFSFIKNWWN